VTLCGEFGGGGGRDVRWTGVFPRGEDEAGGGGREKWIGRRVFSLSRLRSCPSHNLPPCMPLTSLRTDSGAPNKNNVGASGYAWNSMSGDGLLQTFTKAGFGARWGGRGG
jgi:hypothetical protein